MTGLKFKNAESWPHFNENYSKYDGSNIAGLMFSSISLPYLEKLLCHPNMTNLYHFSSHFSSSLQWY